jgi:hypothetical protein
MKRWILCVLLSSTTGCAAMGEAYRDRVGWELGHRTPSITFGCGRPLVPSGEPRLAAERLPIVVDAEPDPDFVQAGEMRGSWIAWVQGRDRIPITLTGPLPNAVLSQDVATALTRHGIAVDASVPADGLRLHVGITELTTDLVLPSWYEIKGTLRGRVAFRTELRRGTETLWDGEFAGGDEVRYAYDLASYRTKVLAESYCQGLEQLEQALSDRTFVQAARGQVRGTQFVRKGYSVMPPVGGGWQLIARSAESVAFGKNIGGMDDTFVAMTAIKQVATAYPTRQDYLAAKKAEVVKTARRYRMLEQEAELDPRFGQFCVRYSARAKDRGPDAEGSPEQQARAAARERSETLPLLEVHGYRFLHRDSPQYEIDISYSTRSRSDQGNAALGREGEAFVASFQFSPLR